MAGLGGFGGADLNPDLTGAFDRAGNAFLKVRELGRQTSADRAALAAAGGDQNARAMLARLDPTASSHIEDIITRKDSAAAEAANKQAEEHALLAAEFLNLPDEKQMDYLTNMAQAFASDGRDISGIARIANIPDPEARRQYARQIMLTGLGAKEALKSMVGGDQYGLDLTQAFDTEGKPVLLQASRSGTPKVVEGYSPVGKPQVVDVSGVKVNFDPVTQRLTDLSGNPLSQEQLSKLVQRAAETKVKQAGAEAGATASAGGAAQAQTENFKAYADNGIAAADSLPNLYRTRDLLSQVKAQGAFGKASLAIRQFFGVEGADEGELSANLGKAVLSQLRSTFGAAFTEKEGQRLASIEAQFGRNPETNKRLVNQVIDMTERAARRGAHAARRLGDEFTASEIERSLGRSKISAGSDEPSGNKQPAKPGAADAPAAPAGKAPKAAVDFLRANPSTANKVQFRKKYGYLPESL